MIYSKEIFDIINKRWGVEFGRKKEVFIAEQFTSNSNIMKKIINGFFATDGSLVITNNNGIWYPRVEFQNTSYTILKQIQEFLASLGIKGGFYKMKRKQSISFGEKVYRLQYNGKENLLKFKEEIGFINPKHQLKFDEFKLEMLG
jgi:intein/homing endonuclease